MRQQIKDEGALPIIPAATEVIVFDQMLPADRQLLRQAKVESQITNVGLEETELRWVGEM